MAKLVLEVLKTDIEETPYRYVTDIFNEGEDGDCSISTIEFIRALAYGLWYICWNVEDIRSLEGKDNSDMPLRILGDFTTCFVDWVQYKKSDQQPHLQVVEGDG